MGLESGEQCYLSFEIFFSFYFSFSFIFIFKFQFRLLFKIIQFQLQFQFHILLLSFRFVSVSVSVLSTRLQIMFNDNLILCCLFSKAQMDRVNQINSA